MLSGLLRSEIAIETNIKIMRAFVAMRRFIVQNAGVLMRIANLMGASLKDMGAGLCAITEMQASPETIVGMLK